MTLCNEPLDKFMQDLKYPHFLLYSLNIHIDVSSFPIISITFSLAFAVVESYYKHLIKCSISILCYFTHVPHHIQEWEFNSTVTGFFAD